MHQVKRVSRIALGTWTTRVNCQYLFQAMVDVPVENPETPKGGLLLAMSPYSNSANASICMTIQTTNASNPNFVETLP